MEVIFYLSTYGFLFLSCRKLCPFVINFHLKVVAKTFVLCSKYLKKYVSRCYLNYYNVNFLNVLLNRYSKPSQLYYSLIAQWPSIVSKNFRIFIFTSSKKKRRSIKKEYI